jgi:hypothetical protein
MPKRRSLVGTGREAIGDSPKAKQEARAVASPPVQDAPKKERRAAPKPKPEPARAAPTSAVAAEPEPMAAEADHKPRTSPASAYEAMLGFANAALRQNLETSARLARCKSPLEVVAAQTAHAAALTQSFIAASLKLMQAGLPGAPWTPWKPRAGSH